MTDLPELARYSGDPWQPGNPFFERAEADMARTWDAIIWPFIGGVVDFSATLDLAAGHGRNSECLFPLAGALTIMDIQPGNVKICQRRFPGATCLVCNGYDLQPLRDGSLTLVYCFASMVHFDSDVVRSYLRDTARVLAPGGRGFFHHSNYTGGRDWRQNPEGRNFMSAEFFGHYAAKEGLRVVQQRRMDRQAAPALDCLTLVERPAF